MGIVRDHDMNPTASHTKQRWTQSHRGETLCLSKAARNVGVICGLAFEGFAHRQASRIILIDKKVIGEGFLRGRCTRKGP